MCYYLIKNMTDDQLIQLRNTYFLIAAIGIIFLVSFLYFLKKKCKYSTKSIILLILLALVSGGIAFFIRMQQLQAIMHGYWFSIKK